MKLAISGLLIMMSTMTYSAVPQPQYINFDQLGNIQGFKIDVQGAPITINVKDKTYTCDTCDMTKTSLFNTIQPSSPKYYCLTKTGNEYIKTYIDVSLSYARVSKGHYKPTPSQDIIFSDLFCYSAGTNVYYLRNS